jgi:hypothetical protein
MKRTAAIIAAAVLLAGTAAAQASELDTGPGVLGPESPLYGLETKWDKTAVNMGLKDAGDVAQERAAEAQDMLEKRKPGAASRAADDLQNIAGEATAEDQQGIQKAQAALQDVMGRMQQRIQDAPNDQARQGVQTAMDSMQNALSNMEQVEQKMQDAMQRAETGEQDPGSGSQSSGTPP